jgi:hypothetical protein
MAGVILEVEFKLGEMIDKFAIKQFVIRWRAEAIKMPGYEQGRWDHDGAEAGPGTDHEGCTAGGAV